MPAEFATRTTSMTTDPASSLQSESLPQRVRLWIDGVGSWLVFLQDSVSIGGRRSDGETADLCLQSDLARRQAEIVRRGEAWWLNPLGVAGVNGKPMSEPVPLHDGYTIELGARVRLTFRQPSALSSSAVIDFTSGHRPADRTDGVVLQTETCLLGPGAENHIHCRQWPAAFVLFRKEGGLWGRCRESWFLNQDLQEGAARLSDGDLVTGADFRFRLEFDQPGKF